MKIWKQLGVCAALLVAGMAAWIFFVPSAATTLAKWGLDIPALASTNPSAGSQTAGTAGNAGGQAQRAATVIAQPATRQTINDRLSAIGTGRALRTVSVLPFVSGRLVEIDVRSGDEVKAGDRIALLDSEVETIALERARIALADAQDKLERTDQLRSTNTVAAVTRNEAQLAVANARLVLREAELTLERRSIMAPIDGIVGILPVSVGDYVTSQSQIVTLDDRSELLIDFWVPERFSGAIEVGAPITANSIARPGDRFTGEVAAIDNRIDAESRTMHVQAKIANADDRLRAGMSFQVGMSFPGDAYPAVDPLAIQWSADGAYVWVVVDEKAERLPVRIIQRNTDMVLVDAELPDGRQVVTEGIQSVRDGAAVRIANRNQQSEPVASRTQRGS